MTRREILAITGAALAPAHILRGAAAPAGRVAVAKCAAYTDAEVAAKLKTMFDQLGGLSKLVGNKTVTVKLNLTGSPGLRFEGRPLGVTHYTHPAVVAATAHLMGEAGAKRIRFVESAWALSGPLEDYLLDSGWNVRQLTNAAPHVEFENTNNLGKSKAYARFKVPGNPYMFPSYDLNPAYRDTDVFVSMAKLKNHATCGVTLSMKNCFGITPASIYGDDAGVDIPNEKPQSGRVRTMHEGRRDPSRTAMAEIDPKSSRDPGYRMPRIVAELNHTRPVDLAIIDGVESIAGGEGPWIRGIRHVQPGVLIAGLNAVNTDAVAAAVMGYDPRAPRGTAPFQTCDNTLLLAEKLGVGSADLSRIEVTGVPIAKALYSFSKA
ncbi:MAG: DUF362 domain-containing protein [Acidobacteriota bacterium]|nr:DUF362 domain-containing protein [Acidobacteriota bacterium]